MLVVAIYYGCTPLAQIVHEKYRDVKKKGRLIIKLSNKKYYVSQCRFGLPGLPPGGR
jgi:hypothetical protein